MNRNLCLSLLVILIPASSAAIAQDGSESAVQRTPASAQRFLALNASATVSYENRGGIALDRVTAVRSTDICRTTFSVVSEVQRWVDPKANALVGIDAWAQQLPASSSWATRMIANPAKEPYERTIDWAKTGVAVGDKEHGSNNIQSYIYVGQDMQSQLSLHYSSADLRDRVLAAIQFLIKSCAKPPEETGF